MRVGKRGNVICEVWRKWSWKKGPDFSKVSFTGMPIAEKDAISWIRKRFRERKIDYSQEF